MAAELIALLIFLFPLAYSPGPGNMLFAANGARFGLRSTIPATVGYHIATVVVTFALGVGFSEAIAFAPSALSVIQIAGSLYVMWLAWKLWQAGRTDSVDASPIGFRDGVVLLLLNPKAYVIIVLMFSQFLDTRGAYAQVALIAVVFTLNNLVAFTLWTVVGDRLAQAARSEENSRLLNRVFGGVLGAVGVWMLFS